MIGNNPKNAAWIKNRATFTATGIGANSEAVAHVPKYGTPRSAIARV
ncbi:hypothetical protein [Crossiella cryophila]|uniref:Uncharacterized protein n=1 Tax=Crossiella cryophila TaxID=43355 RepID=A0A7W7CBG5_9PSEU|nr:hypothetical protein [Crossiella cryophila]MBB4678085.1 hypothetical protein [Crossiella cryophila]